MATHSVQLAVPGMTCGHCVSHVTSELETLDGIEEINVDLNPEGESLVTVTSSTLLSEADLRTAVDEAGYDITAITRS